MLSCDKATILMEKRLDTDLSLMDKINLAFHTSMCSGCRNYKKQTKTIHELLNSMPKTDVTSLHAHMIARLKLDILNHLDSIGE